MRNKIEAWFKKALCAYIECAMWSSTDEDGTPLDNGEYTLAEEAREKMAEELWAFINKANEKDLLDGIDYYTAAHDFWLTRNGHGASFWDGDYDDVTGDALTELSHTFGECNLYAIDGLVCIN